MKVVTQVTQSEDQLQAEFWQWAWNTYPQFRRQMWAVPNGSNRNPIEASRLKATGLLAGVWDLHCFNKNVYSIIEMKVPGNYLTVDRIINGKKHYGQKEWGEIMAANGAIRYVCYSVDEAKTAYLNIFSPRPEAG